MDKALQVVQALEAPGLFIVVVVVLMVSGFKKGWIGQFITALNSLNTPWVATIVIILGMVYNLKCKVAGLPSDSANQVIGGGLGLLTGQALKNNGRLATELEPPPPPQTTDQLNPNPQNQGEIK